MKNQLFEKYNHYRQKHFSTTVVSRIFSAAMFESLDRWQFYSFSFPNEIEFLHLGGIDA